MFARKGAEKGLAMAAVDLIEVWRGDLAECVHRGHVVVAGADGGIVQAWGDPGAVFYPRSAFKMIQALPLIESGAADAVGLRVDQLALACASHQAAAIHTDRVQAWLAALGLTDDDLRCGPQTPNDVPARDQMIKTDKSPCQYHNNCSGKHSGFLTLNRHLGGGAEYIDIDHPVQKAVFAAFEETTGEDSPGYGIDGCSAPSHATSVLGLARAMAQFATARDRSDTRSLAQTRLVDAMTTYPELVSGEGEACTELMRACGDRVAIKGGADGAYVAILPDLRLGVALKIVDGSQRAKEAAIAAVLIKLGVLDAAHPAAKRRVNTVMRNWRGIAVGTVRAPAIA